MKRRNALSAMAGLAASSALGGGVATGLPQALADESPLPQRYCALSPVRDKAPIVVANLGVGLSMISGPGGNVTALAGQDGVVLGDSFVPGRGADLAAVVRKLGDGPVTLINTHWHLDHTGGNAALAKIGARIVAHPSVRDRLGSDQYMADFEMKVPPSQAAALPVVTLGDSAMLFLNGEEVHLRHVAPAHTDGDIFIHYRKANVLHTGDLFGNGAYPGIDVLAGGWIGGVIAAVDLLLGIVDPKTKIIPGHGPMATREDLKAARAMLAEARNKVEPLVDAGKTVDEVIAARPLAALDARWGRGLIKGSDFTRSVYNGLSNHRAAK